MWDILTKHYSYSLVIFLVLAVIKGAVEIWGKQHQNKGGQETSIFISWYFIIIGSLTPLLIFWEVFFVGHSFPLIPSLILAGTEIALLAVRVAGIKELGRFYSVNVRITEDHTLIKTGIYKCLRHPLYLVGILENIIYPLACGAYISALLLIVFGTPAILIRRREEETLLLESFGDEYREYMKETWF